MLALVEGAGLRPGPWRGVSVVADLLEATSGADPRAVRALELALAEAVALPRHRHRPARPRHAVPVTGPAAAGPGGAALRRRHPRRRAARRRDRPRRPGRARRPAGRSARPHRRARAAPAGSLVLLVDGLGADLLRTHADLAPTLAGLARPVGDLSAPCPSTTPVSLATLGTGLPPGSHGILGFVTDVPGEDRTLNHVQWADDPDPDVWQARRTVFEQAQAAGVAATAVGPYAYAGSGLTRAVYRGADLHRRGQPRRPLRARPAARWPRPRGRSSTATSPSSTSPATSAASTRPAGGPSSRSSTALVEQLVAGLPDDAALLVTADHGMLDVPARDPARPRRRARRWPTASGCWPGSPAPGTCTPSPARRTTSSPRGARCSATGPGWPAGTRRSRSGVFGPVDDAVAARIGDVVALARGSWALVDPGARARAEPAGRLPRLAHRDRARDPAAGRPGPRRSAEPVSDTCQVRECAGWVARQVRRSATADGRLSTAATTGPSGPAIVTTQRSTSAPGGVDRPDRRHRQVVERRAAPAPRGRGAGRPDPAAAPRPGRAATAAPPARARAPRTSSAPSPGTCP